MLHKMISEYAVRNNLEITLEISQGYFLVIPPIRVHLDMSAILILYAVSNIAVFLEDHHNIRPIKPMNLKSLIAELSLPEATTAESHGSSSFFSTARLHVPASGETPAQTLFLKYAKSPHSVALLSAEARCLKEINTAVPEFAPTVRESGQAGSSGTGFLLMDFVDGSKTGGLQQLAERLAKLHDSTSENGKFGWDSDTYCGETVQEAGGWNTWEEMFTERMKSLSRKSRDGEVQNAVQSLVNTVVPRLIGGKNEKPSLVHGDLWTGNAMGGMVIDPCCSYSSSEFDFGIMRMFGGFSSQFWKTYHDLRPKAEPINEYDDRVALYESYHHLNHYVLFGGSYKSSALRIWRTLEKKYA